jgi:hypothetical protein
MRREIRSLKSLREKHETRRKVCGLIRILCRRGGGGRGTSVSGQAYFLALARLSSACVALSGTRIVGLNKSGSGWTRCHPPCGFLRPPPTIGLPARPLCPSRFVPAVAIPCSAQAPTTQGHSKATVFLLPFSAPRKETHLNLPLFRGG